MSSNTTSESIFDRDQIIADLQSFYSFLPHVPEYRVHRAPPGGWEIVTSENLVKHNIHKTAQVTDLLQHIPYISGSKPWIGPMTLVMDYRRVAGDPNAREKPGWLFNAADTQWPEWVVQLTDGEDREGKCWLLDITDGTVSQYCACSGYAPSTRFTEDDTRRWRNLCYPDSIPLREWLDSVREEYLNFKWLGLPQPEAPLADAPEIITQGCTEMEDIQSIYRTHGWPDAWRKDACIQALGDWWQQHSRS